MDKKLVTTKDICEYFSICRVSVERWRKYKNLPFHIIGTRSVRFDMEEVLEWMEKYNKDRESSVN